MKIEEIYEDKYFYDTKVPEGQLFVFIGYDTGLKGGKIVKRYKDSNGNFGSM